MTNLARRDTGNSGQRNQLSCTNYTYIYLPGRRMYHNIKHITMRFVGLAKFMRGWVLFGQYFMTLLQNKMHACMYAHTYVCIISKIFCRVFLIQKICNCNLISQNPSSP